jgi:hypothetical protein
LGAGSQQDLDFDDKAIASTSDLFADSFEIGPSSVNRIGDLSAADVIKEHANLGSVSRRAGTTEHVASIPLVHDEDEVEALQIVVPEDASPKLANAATSPSYGHPRPGIGASANVFFAGACTRDPYLVRKPFGRELRSEDSFRHDGTADIPVTNEENAVFRIGGRRLRTPRFTELDQRDGRRSEPTNCPAPERL